MIKEIIKNEVFEVNLELFYSKDVSELKAFMDIEEENFFWLSWTQWFLNYCEERHVLRLFLLTDDPDIISHESVHIWTKIMKEVWIPINYDNDEVLAYLVWFYVRSIYSLIHKQWT